VKETISAVEFIGRMSRHLPPNGFRLVLRSEGLLRRVAMVRYYGIYAQPGRNKIHALVVDTLNVLARKAEQISQRTSFLNCARQPKRNPSENSYAEVFSFGLTLILFATCC